ncbi:fluoride export 2 [Olea europaea subsp. europaea]|uniref:Fluoride export 2 n=1 Tax=Olea europaea subsp. europaea TaxID=158383 RepID=A0A8S0U5W9_OLEEU|nr:fluoride export 2 [Olea europaea subsp. europaea]
MDRETHEFVPRRSGSFGRASSANSSLRRQSSNLSFAIQHLVDDDVESESISEAGDIGDRALYSRRYSESGRHRFSFDNVIENGVVVPIQEDAAVNTDSPVSPSTLQTISPLSTDAIHPSKDKKKEHEKEAPGLLKYGLCLLSLAIFGILGVLTRYGLQKLFGPHVVGATSDQSYMYPDVPSNMVGSFLMGWFGVVFKDDIAKVSDELAIGLSTGFLGSLTTFSGWNQKMLDLSCEGRWMFAFLGFLIGLLLAASSIVFGIHTAKGFKWLLISVFGILAKREFNSHSAEAQLFLACIVGPLGVWIRWFLARFNGRGGSLKWIPLGTLTANILAACIMAVLATLKKTVDTKNFDTVASALQLGLLGCLSTVSTFIAEFHKMMQSKNPWMAYAYASITIGISFILGTLIYSVPSWAKGYH